MKINLILVKLHIEDSFDSVYAIMRKKVLSHIYWILNDDESRKGEDQMLYDNKRPVQTDMVLLISDQNDFTEEKNTF